MDISTGTTITEMSRLFKIGMLMEELEQIAERFSRLPARPPNEADLKEWSTTP